MMKKTLAFALVAGMVSTSSADVIQVTTNNDESPNGTSYGFASGSLSWDITGATTGLLSLTLTNESVVGGFITAVAFDAPQDFVSASFAFDSTTSTGLSADWANLAGASVDPFGQRDFGASISSSWAGGGNPDSGVGAGDTATWVWNATFDSASTSVSDFLSDDNFLLRFRGFDNGDSDKVPLVGIPDNVVPGLGGLAALIGVGGFRRRRR